MIEQRTREAVLLGWEFRVKLRCLYVPISVLACRKQNGRNAFVIRKCGSDADDPSRTVLKKLRMTIRNNSELANTFHPSPLSIHPNSKIMRHYFKAHGTIFQVTRTRKLCIYLHVLLATLVSAPAKKHKCKGYEVWPKDSKSKLLCVVKKWSSWWIKNKSPSTRSWNSIQIPTAKSFWSCKAPVRKLYWVEQSVWGCCSQSG